MNPSNESSTAELSLRQELASRVRTVVQRIIGERAGYEAAWFAPCNDEKFGDFQFNGALPLAKALKEKPRDVATKISEALSADVAGHCEPLEIAGPGFINFRVKPQAVADRLTTIRAGDQRLGVSPAADRHVVIVDMSSPNLAKEMHVGHLRSTVIGECAARILEFMGHDVHRINHVGDWGTQFGMLVAHLRSTRPEILDNPDALQIDNLESFYVEAKAHFDRDPEFADEARRTVVQLQGGDESTLKIWRAFCHESLRHCHEIYRRLDVKMEDRGESFYNDMLAETVNELEDRGLAVVSEGALCMFMDGFANADGDPLPMIIRKSDGGFNYSATDMAAMRHRLQTLGAKRLIYIVGAPQKLHFEMLFAATRKTGWAGSDVAFEHLAFGSILAKDGRPFKTREGGTLKLRDLLNEGVHRARAFFDSADGDDRPGRDLTDAQKDEIANVIGVNSVRYFDLSHNLASDYKFDWDTMLSLEGNTAPYMLYAYARIRSIGRKAGIDFDQLPDHAPISLEHEAEVRLAKTLVRFPDVVNQVAQDLRPNLLTEYLFELSKAFSRFYDRKLGVRVIDASPESIKISRLRLCDLTARTLRAGLSLLGIPTIEQM
jgi:arginyl-tRNA synthetase